MSHRSGARSRSAGVLASALVLAAAVVVTAQPPAESPSFDELYRRGSAINATLKTLTARFTETTTSSLLTQPLEASGTLAVERPSRVVLHYEQPEPRDVLIDGDRLIVSWPGRGIRDVRNISAANRRIQSYFVESTPDELRESFDITSGTADDRLGAHLLTLVPRRSQIREGLNRLELWLDGETLLLSAMRMTFPGGDTKLMVLDEVQVNRPLDPAVFSLRPLPAPAR